VSAIDPSRYQPFVGLSQAQLGQLAEAELCRRDFGEFVWRAWQVIRPNEPLSWAPYMTHICRHLGARARGEIGDVILNMPPGLAKSLIAAVFWPAWIWTWAPWWRFLICTSIEDNVFRDSREMRALVDSRWYRRHFRSGAAGIQSWQVLAEQKAKGYWGNTAGGERIGKTCKAEIIGIKAHALVIDDPHGAGDIEGDLRGLTRSRVWFREGASSRLIHPSMPTIITHQRQHEADLTGSCLLEGAWEHLSYPNEYDGVVRSTSLGPYDERTEPDQLLAPDRYDAVATAKWKARLQERYEPLFQQRPTPAGGAMFKTDWLQYWTEPPDDLQVLFTSTDPGWVKGRRNDPTVIQLWGGRGTHLWLLAQMRARWDPVEMIAGLCLMASRARDCAAHLIEQAGIGRALIMQLAGKLNRVIPVRVQGRHKRARGAAATPVWADRRIWLPHPHIAKPTVWQPDGYRWVETIFLPELLSFTGQGDSHDDQVDAMTQAVLAFCAADDHAVQAIKL